MKTNTRLTQILRNCLVISGKEHYSRERATRSIFSVGYINLKDDDVVDDNYDDDDDDEKKEKTTRSCVSVLVGAL